MRKMALAMLAVAALTGLVLASNLNPDLIAKLNTSSPNEFIRIEIRMQEQADYQAMMAQTAGLDKKATRTWVVNYLQDMANRTQANVKAYLDAQAAAGKVKNMLPVFIVNMFQGLATPDAIRGLESFPEIAEVNYDPEQYLLTYQPSNPANIKGTDETDEITWGVSDINAPAVWAMGYNGTGVLVGMIDTGVNYNHLDLADHMWNGGSQYPHHGWDFYNNDNDPIDDGPLGHGSHTAGTVASDGTAGTQAGVAPNATIMAIKTLSGGGNGTEGQTISGIGFAVQQGCDIFSMSLGWQTTSQRANFRTACNNALAAGTIGAIAAGNEGAQQGFYPVPGNVRTPGDCPPPWLNPAQTLTGGLSCVVTVGATTEAHVNAYFSSVGPVSWTGVSPWNDYAYNPGMGLIDPDVAAPGVNTKSCLWNNNSGYTFMDGTSMATPHVAGTMALMLDKNPNLTPAQIDQYLEMTALDWGSPGKDNLYGAGRIDAAAAVAAVPGGTTPNVTITLTPTGSTALPATGGTLNFNLAIQNNDTFSNSFVVWLELTYPSGSSSGPLLLRNVTLGAGGSIFRAMTQNIPGRAPNGSYTYWGRVGAFYGGTVYSQSSFPFTKGTANAGSGNWVNDNSVSGWNDAVVSAQVPQEYSLEQNFPNPFNPTTTIPFGLPNSGHVSLKVFNLSGQEVATVMEGDLSAGQYRALFNGSSLPSGIYLYRLETPDYQKTMKLTLIK